jgi:membrane peptidoglycan carboxypeptidase
MPPVGLAVQADTSPGLAPTHVGSPELPGSTVNPARRRRWLRRVLVGLLTLVLLLAAGFGLAWGLTPGVGNAEALTQAIVARNHAISDQGNPPAKVSAALIATEDSRFYSHHGLDPESLARGVVHLVTNGKIEGATLDAQLAKLLYSDGHTGVWETSQEAILAIKLDSKYSKRQILSMYLDAAYFGHGAYGVETAARTYFGIPAEQLSWGQATLLAGLVNAPTAYDPTAHLQLARERQQHVLDRLVATHKLTRQQANAVYAEPLHPAIPFAG